MHSYQKVLNFKFHFVRDQNVEKLMLQINHDKSLIFHLLDNKKSTLHFVISSMNALLEK